MMDDNIELPTATPKSHPSQDREEEEQSSGDEDQGPDWTKIPGIAVARPVIPKRGEKDFEPSAQGGSGLQRHVLDRSRSAMFDALKATRTISYKSVSHAIWYPELGRAHVSVARGIHFTIMGHSVARACATLESAKKIQKRLELLPEEALYLVERGAMFCWKPTDLLPYRTELLDDMEGVPMSVQQAYAEMVGAEGLTLERYQVYAYLRRLGYVVTRANPPSSEYPIPPPTSVTRAPRSALSRLYGTITSFLSRLAQVVFGDRDWWRPLRFSRWFHHNMDNASVFRSLRFLPCGYDIPLHMKRIPELQSPYQIFYHLYKPSTPYKKTAPPSPDFSLVVVNARTTSVPTISELTDLFGELPELPPPVPRKRISFAQQKLASQQVPSNPLTPAPAPAPVQPSLARKVLAWIWPLPQVYEQAKASTRPTNPFPSLKTGKKMVVVAVVDAGTISFFRFGQGVFTEWPMS